ncbi:MAG: amino acid permease [Acidobacteria bacterium]|nr:amino acid permease [Acidobacteriota bacterium]
MAQGYRRELGIFSATMLIAGSMIGSGVYIVGADIVRTGHTGSFLLWAWVLTGLMTVVGALNYGELAGLFPRAGGQYAYLREIYGPLTGFLYGWTFFTVIECGTIAAVAVGFGKYLGAFLPWVSETRWLVGPLHVPALQATREIAVGPYDLGLTSARFAGIAMILLLSLLNAYGVKMGARIQNLFTVAKIGSLAALILLGLTLRPGSPPDPAPFVPAAPGPPLSLLVLLLVVQTGSLFSADAWNSITFIAGEVKEPRRTIPLSLLIGTVLVCTLYVLANAAYLKVLGPTGIATAPGDRVGSLALRALFGPVGELAMAGAILWSMFGCQNGLVLSGARVYQAMAEDGLFLPPAARLNARGVPAFALGVQALWASALTLSGSYGQLLDYVIFAALLFYSLTVGGVLILRLRRPDLDRPVRVPLYPALPLLYLAGALAIMGALLLHRPAVTWPGLAIVLAGIPLYFVIRPRRANPEVQE